MSQNAASYAEALSVCLRAAGATDALSEPDFLECLTTMPFGCTYLEFSPDQAGIFLPSGASVDPHGGIDLALKALGWSAFEWHASADQPLDEAVEEALSITREALERFGPALAGPVSTGDTVPMGDFEGDFIAVTSFEEDEGTVVRASPRSTRSRLPLGEFTELWRAETVAYRRGAYTLRARFKQREGISKSTVLARAVPVIRAKLFINPAGERIWGGDGPRVYGGADALRKLAEDLEAGTLTEPQSEWLADVAFPIASARRARGAAFFHDAVKPKAAANLSLQAERYNELAMHVGSDKTAPQRLAADILVLADLEDRLLLDLK